MLTGEEQQKSAEIFAEFENVEAVIATARERARALAAEVEVLEKQVRLARGTKESVKVEKEEAVKPKELGLMARLEMALRAKPSSLEELVKVVGESVPKVSAALKGARTTGRLRNIGMSDRPIWFWRPGPEANSKEVKESVLGLIKHQPMSFVDIKAVTGAKESQLQGALIEIRRSIPNVKNLGTPEKIRYFILPDGAMDATLPSKANK